MIWSVEIVFYKIQLYFRTFGLEELQRLVITNLIWDTEVQLGKFNKIQKVNNIGNGKIEVQVH